jgi:alpha-L-fucosidase
MRLHGRAIYGATASDWSAPADCRFTQRGNRLYVHIFAWPMQALHLPGLAGRVEYAQLLHDGSEIPLQSNGHDDSLPLTLPVQRPDVLVPVLELFLR